MPKELVYQVPEMEEKRILSDAGLNDIIQVLKSGKFHVYDQKNYIPKSVLQVLGEWQNGKIRFANRGSKYRKGCVVANPRLPSREITTILKSDQYFVMTYNHGGRSFHRHILFCELNEGDVVKNIWIGDVTREFFSKEDVIRELRQVCKRTFPAFVCY